MTIKACGIGFIHASTRSIFGRTYAAEPDVLIEQLKKDEAIAEADTTLLLAVFPNQLGVVLTIAHIIEAILTHVSPGDRLALRPVKPYSRSNLKAG